MDENINYVRNLIKGKIVETIFEEMFRTTGEFTILHTGYEHTIPELAQYQHHVEVKQVLENIRHAPDFVLISQDKTKVFLVEVKFRSKIDKDEIFKIADETLTLWNPSYLFIASNDGFYFSPCNKITNNNGQIEKLTDNWIEPIIQNEYLILLKKFIPEFNPLML